MIKQPLNIKLDWKNLAVIFSNEAQLKRIAYLVNLGLLVSLSYQIAVMSWKLLPGPDLSLLPTSISSAVATSVASPQTAKAWNIANLHLFGIKQDNISDRPRTEKAPETTLNLLLRGVYASENPVDGAAIIGEANGLENYYSVNAKLPGGATLKEVYSDKVILLSNGRFETLSLPKDDVNLDAGESVSTPTPTPQSQTQPPPRSQDLPISAKAGDSTLNSYRYMLKNNPQRLAKMVKIQPVNEGGQFVGYKLDPGKEGGLFDCAGLKPGDIVTGLNGIKLDNPVKGLNALRAMADENEFQIEVLRNGAVTSFSRNINECGG